jgi:hypothetical protein
MAVNLRHYGHATASSAMPAGWPISLPVTSDFSGQRDWAFGHIGRVMRSAQAHMAMFNTECADHGGRGLWFFRRQADNFRRMSGRNRRVERAVASTDDAFHPGKAGSRVGPCGC